MSAGHPAVAGRRPVSLIVVAATVLGLWFGLRPPEVSPVTPTDQAVQMQPADDDGCPPGEQRRGGRR